MVSQLSRFLVLTPSEKSDRLALTDNSLGRENQPRAVQSDFK